ncbi:hypothetical protein QWY99_08300 [Flavobacterium branchiarum]|uniref:GerMN domain-containing protein n=1 Tax=Flavobacterium branchiarum TaxID=1114870 RepID=A0ABV5FRK8_9FLAO|nr:hypothetical protein [Flavobacterium branchiarum]MDN3673046.1 hypothetical protein [Flavobacterium branchiarum]
MKKRINLNTGHLILLIVIFFIFYFCLKDIFKKNEIENNGKEIVVKFTSKEILPKTTNFYFTYFIDGKKIKSANSGINYSVLNSENETNNINDLEINTFYLAKSIPKYPNTIIVNLQKKVTDTLVILNAGFSREDIKNSDLEK